MKNYIFEIVKNADIMIVDDNPGDVNLLAAILSRRDHHVRFANSGELALASLEVKVPDLILLDIKLPGIDGYEVCRRIKTNPRTQEIPVAFLTAQGNEEDKIKGYNLRIADYITKPYQAEEILSRIDNLLHINFLQKELQSRTERLENIIEGTNAGTWELNMLTGEEIINERWAEMIGYRVSELEPVSMQTWLENCHSEDTLRIRKLLNEIFLKKIDSFDIEFRMKHKNGSWIWVNGKGRVNSWTDDGKPLMTSGIHTDITERKVSEDILHKNNAFQKLISTISTDLLNATMANIDEKVNGAIKVLGDFFDIDRCYLYQIDQAENGMVLTHEWHAPGIPKVIRRMREPFFEQFSWWNDQLNAGELLYIKDLEEIPEGMAERKFFKRSKVKSLLNIQITENHKIRGFLGFESITSSRYWEADQIDLLRVIANSISDALSRNRMIKELLSAKENAEKENYLKTEFFTNMTHELKTPITIMLSTVQLFEIYAKNGVNLGSAKAIKHLKALKQNGFRLLKISNNLIDMAKFDSGFLETKFMDYDIVDLIGKIVQSVEEYAYQKKARMIFEAEVEEKLIKCDADMLERIILNLISNAIKFSKKNCDIKIAIKGGTDYITISVKDNGIGIAKEYQSAIFERYKQISLGILNKPDGSGIGLALTKSLVELHEGTITVESELGEGSNFIIKLPNTLCGKRVRIQKSFDIDQFKTHIDPIIKLEFSDIND